MQKTTIATKRSRLANVEAESLPKSIAWAKHFTGRNFGKRFAEIAAFAKAADLREELPQVSAQSQALEKLMGFQLSMSLEELRRHGGLRRAVDRQKGSIARAIASTNEQHWRKAVGLILATRNPVVGTLLCRYGDHIQCVAGNIYFLGDNHHYENSTFRAAWEYIAEVSRNRNRTDLQASAYRLVRAISGSHLAYYCGIDPRYSVVSLINGALDEIEVGNESLARSLVGLGKAMTTPYFFNKLYVGDKSYPEEELCQKLSLGTGFVLKKLSNNTNF